jgi:IS605 OrfB family transposase
VVRALAGVAASYKASKSHQHTFRSDAAVVLDTPRLYRLRATLASIATPDGRIEVPLAMCGRRLEQLAAATKIAEADHILDENGRWRLLVAAHYADPPPRDPTDVLGVDLGIVNIAADSDGTVYSAAHHNALRHRHRRLRRRLQVRHTASARKLRRRREARFAKDVNHCISKRIVAVAERTGRAIALEDFRGIRDRVTARRSQRATLHSWSFAQLRRFITYKAAMRGIPVILVDPRNSSRTCPSCGCIDKRNRLSQACFSCVSCNFSGLADTIAATVLWQRGRAAVNLPYIPSSGVLNAGRTSPLPSGVGC